MDFVVNPWAAAMAGILFLATDWWEPPNPLRWLVMSGLALSYLLWIFWRGLGDNHRPGESNLLPTLGWATCFRFRAVSSWYCFVVFFSLPGLIPLEGLAAQYALYPGGLPDFVDGIVARLTNHITKLGETLDISIDSLGVLGVSLLSVQYRQVPWWYLSVGLARYFFLAGIWLRKKMRSPGLRFALQRTAAWLCSSGDGPVFGYPVPHLQTTGNISRGWNFCYYILGGFLWDWLVTIGWLPPKPGERYLRFENLVVKYVPLFLRLLLILWGFASLLGDLLAKIDRHYYGGSRG